MLVLAEYLLKAHLLKLQRKSRLNTRRGAERVIRDAFARAAAPRTQEAHPGS